MDIGEALKGYRAYGEAFWGSNSLYEEHINVKASSKRVCKGFDLLES